MHFVVIKKERKINEMKFCSTVQLENSSFHSRRRIDKRKNEYGAQHNCYERAHSKRCDVGSPASVVTLATRLTDFISAYSSRNVHGDDDDDDDDNGDIANV